MDNSTSAKVGRRQEKQRQAAGFSSAAAASHGFSVEPQIAIVDRLIYDGVVIIHHMIGKYRKDTTVTA